MAIYYFHKENIGRGYGQAVIEAAAYRSGERLHDNYYGKIYNYTNRRDVVHCEIFLPDNAPLEFKDRAVLWNTVEMSEKRHDARTAHEFKIALPRELTPTQSIELIREYVKENFISKGMIADIAVHDKGLGKAHCS